MPNFIERDCTFTHDGRTFKAGGAVITDEVVIGYVGKAGDIDGCRTLTDWHGARIGRVRLLRSWRTPRSYVSDRMWQAEAVVNGRTYTGRTAGESMIFKGRETAASRKVRALLDTDIARADSAAGVGSV